jgi:hypothetical protein
MVAFDNSIFCLALHPDAKSRVEVERAKERVEYLLECLEEANERVLLPAPAFAEFLVLAGRDAPKYLSMIRDNAIFRIEPFDEKASIELADMEIAARELGNKRGSAVDSAWQKVKFDRQIVAIAKAHGVTTLYSDDPHIQQHGKDCGIAVLALSDLPVRPAFQEKLDLQLEDQQNGIEQKAITAAPEVLGSSDGHPQGEAGAKAAEEAASGEDAGQREDT